jgi:hypothetical protein
MFFFWVDPSQPIWPVTRSLDRVDHRVGFKNYAYNRYREVPTGWLASLVGRVAEFIKKKYKEEGLLFFWHKVE